MSIRSGFGANTRMTGFANHIVASSSAARPGLADPEPPNPFIPSTTYKQWLPPGPLQKEWMPLTPLEKMAETEYDALIVGSGAGGSAVLWRLCEQWANSGRKIGMIESGPLLLPTHGRNLPTMDQERFVQFFENPLHTDYIGRYWPEYPGARIIRALGGRTLQWNLVTPRLTARQFESWPISYREIVPYYRIAEEAMDVTTGYAKGSSIQRTLLRRLQAQGIPGAQALPVAADLQAGQFGIIHADVFTSSINFLAKALNIRPFDLAVHARATQVLTYRGRAAGVKVMTPDMRSFAIPAKAVIVSAGTWETPRLLLHSGIPGKAIGHYLVNHPKLTATAKGFRHQFGEVSGVASLMIPNPDNGKILMTGIGPGPEQYYWYAYKDKPYLNELKFRFYCQGTMEPRFDNHVVLVPGTEDEYGVPRLQVKFSYSNQDRVMIDEQFKFLGKAVALMGLGFEEAPRLLVPGEDNHESGTCRMGLDPDTSATDLHGQIHGIPGLFVADNSVVRLSGPAHPTLTTAALAIRTADYIGSELK
jgi:gluconate 5-dehydrogenase